MDWEWEEIQFYPSRGFRKRAVQKRSPNVEVCLTPQRHNGLDLQVCSRRFRRQVTRVADWLLLAERSDFPEDSLKRLAVRGSLTETVRRRLR